MSIHNSIRRVQFVTIWSADLAASRHFYIEQLGLPLLDEQPEAFLQFEIAGVPVCVDLHEGTSTRANNRIGVEVDSLDPVVAQLEWLGHRVTCGVRPVEPTAWAAVKDPDGHEIIFIERAEVQAKTC